MQLLEFFVYIQPTSRYMNQSPLPIVKCKTVSYMKTLDRRAAEIFRKMLALQTTKIDNSDGTYMPVYLELIGRIDKYDFFSLTHY